MVHTDYWFMLMMMSYWVKKCTVIPKFAGSNPAEAVGFLKGDKKSSARLPSEGK
jgi:hypothetical protein